MAKFRINDDTERAVYKKAVRGATGLGYKGKVQAGTDAVLKYRKGLTKAVDKGVEEGTLRERIAARQKKID